MAGRLNDMAYRRIVLKLGSSTLAAGTDRLNRPRMVDLVRQIAVLRVMGLQVVVVSSGAALAGREALGETEFAREIPKKQVFAAVGQSRLMHLYAQLFELYDIIVAQALLTRADLADRTRYLNARNTLLALLDRGVVPIINENDVVTVNEIKIGDNDNLSALVANLVDADLLVILTDTHGLYTADPRLDPNARLISEVPVIDAQVRKLAGETSTRRGTGGFITKIQAAELATRSGTEVVIANGAEPDVVKRVVQGENLGTRFRAQTTQIESRKRWILAEPPHGNLTIDAGACKALVGQGRSLLPAGVVAVAGEFDRGETVRICAMDGAEIARGLTNYNARDLRLIQGARSSEILPRLGYDFGAVVVHRNDLVLVG